MAVQDEALEKLACCALAMQYIMCSTVGQSIASIYDLSAHIDLGASRLGKYGACGVRTGISEVLVPLDLPLGSNGDIGLERHSQLHQVDGGGTPDDNVWALVGGGNVLGEVVLAWKVSCNLQPRWQVALAEVEDD